MKTFQKGVFVEGAQKAERLPDGTSIKEAIENTKNIPVLTEDNVEEFFNAKYPIIKYDSDIYYLYYGGNNVVDYFWFSSEERLVNWLEINNIGGTIHIVDVSEYQLVTQIELENDAGTKLYRHEIMFTSNSSTTGNIDIAGIAMPIYIINKRSLPYALSRFNVQLGDNDGTIMMCNDDRAAFTTIRYNSIDDKMQCFTSIDDAYINYHEIGDFSDTVTPL